MNLIPHYADPHDISITFRYRKTVLNELRFIILSNDIKNSSISIDNYSLDTVRLGRGGGGVNPPTTPRSLPPLPLRENVSDFSQKKRGYTTSNGLEQ